jgi:hypothetical protein
LGPVIAAIVKRQEKLKAIRSSVGKDGWTSGSGFLKKAAKSFRTLARLRQR